MELWVVAACVDFWCVVPAAASSYPNSLGPDAVLTFLVSLAFLFKHKSPAAFSSLSLSLVSLLPPSSPLNQHKFSPFSRLYPYSGLILCGLGPLHSRLTCGSNTC